MSYELRVIKQKPGVRNKNSEVTRSGIFALFIIIFFFASCPLPLAPAAYAERIKDIAHFEGVRDNQLIGNGVVVGLDGTGDKGQAAVQGIINMLKRTGLTISLEDLKSKNIAAVIVTATLPPFAKPGTRVDTLVSTIGDAKSIQGGTLLLTPLKGPDGKVYALAQGPLSIGGFAAEGEGSKAQKNHLAAGKIPEGATIEREPPFVLGNGGSVRLFLHRADFTTAHMIAGQINDALHGSYAVPADSSSVRLSIPDEYQDSLVGLITKIESLDVRVDMTAKIVINERTGTVVVGENVTISPVAIAHGSLSIEIRETPEVSQPLPFAPKGAETVTLPRTEISVKEQKGSLVQISGVTLGEVIKALNALGVTPRDLISILQALKAAGALKAELEII
ncbi:MAG: flagellar basal body P-ring protein FlgI [Nitrospiraceae bacterium]|nr:MAG: flagellar basal body P-ring protein FlgI [Nitrospiraceae bacterium]